MRFREHRGALADSLATTVEVNGLGGLIAHLASLGHMIAPEAIEFTQLGGGGDDRIGWRDVHLVTVRGVGAIGFCEGGPIAALLRDHDKAMAAAEGRWIMSDDICPDWKDGRHFYREGFIGSDGRFYRLEDAEHVPGGMVYAGKRCVCGKTVQGPSVQPRISDRIGKY